MRDVSRRSLLAGVAAGVVAPGTFGAGSRPTAPSDENYWAKVASQYDVTREVIQLENGNWGIMARARGVDAIVDSAHAWGQIDFNVRELGFDFAGFNLHKWMGAPLGVGVLYIRKHRIPDIDVYMASEEHPSGDVRARVHTGTSNFAAFLTVPEALDFQDAIGIQAKEARLRYLRDSWAEPLRDDGRIQILTPSDRRLYGGITSFRLPQQPDSIVVAKKLLDDHGIFTVHRTGIAGGSCVRVTPSLFTSKDHIDRLIAALLSVVGQ